jgi:hypothetical protein
MSVAIQWHISLHSGLSRLGASGSVAAIVSWGVLFFFLQRSDGEVSKSLILGSGFVSEGLRVLP